MKFFAPILFIISAFSFCYSQSPDTTLSVNKDSVRILSKDSLAVQDSTKKKKSIDVDTVIYSSSKDSLFFHVNQKKMDLFGSSELKYKDTDLKSADITIDFVTHDVNAKGVPNDSLPGKFKDTPVLTQGSEAYDGETMIYNFKNGRGFITSADTKSDGTKYSGDKIKKVDKNVYFVQDGIFTTCTETPPHYYFYSSEMKVIQKQEIDAQWIWLYFGGVPFPIPIPFGVFPLQSGRRSGIIPPAFGQDGTKGYYFSHFGYFWAINDYYDINLTSDYYTRGSYALNSRFRYNKRYDLGGSVEGGYKILNNENEDGSISKDKEWSLSVNHQENFTPTMRMTANLSFLSGKNYVQSTSTDLNEALTNTVYSNATLTKSWDESGNSLSLSYSRSQDLIGGNISEVLPSLSFSIPQQYPFRRNGVFNDLKWYEMLGFNYNGLFENERNKTNGDLSVRGGIEHKVYVSASPKIGYFNITPNLSYTEDWYNKQTKIYSAGPNYTGTGDSTITEDVHKLSEVRTFSLGVNASTKFYGMFQPNILGISAIRQIVTPTIGYSFTPDFSKQGWGYYGSYTNYLGQKVVYDKYVNEILSKPSSGESQSINFSLGNEFDMKTAVDPSDTTDKEKKIQLLNLTASVGYNFAADSVKFSDIGLSYHTQAGDWLSFQGSSSFSLYDWDANGANINKFLINEGKGFVRLKNFSFSVSTSLSADKFKSSVKDTTKNNLESEAFIENQSTVNKGIYNQGDPDFTMPWSMSLGYNYSFSRNNPTSNTQSSNVSASLDFNLTKQWKFSVAGSYDFMANEVSAPQIRISRDLECWLMNFTWNPIGTYSGYYFEIRVKAPQLQDLKVTKRGDFYNDK
ncbi:MAG: putative LPS assembly protein LptD [Ignavibacteriaceae bacterium]|nr:putative LPS assembly protein LptD [Ignavibacteriaceae bacterium]